MHPDRICTCSQAPSKLLTPTIIALPILCRMRSLSDPGDHAGEGGEPEHGIDDVDERVEVGIGKTAYPSENRESGLVDESRYAAPTLQEH